MSLSKTEAEKLFDLGFKRPVYADEVYPQDVYEHKNTTWVIGGRIVPSSTLLCGEEIYKQGTWIPSMTDLITWLEEMDCEFTLSLVASGYKVEVYTSDEQSFKGKGISVEMVLFKVICRILKAYRGTPVQNKYKVIDAEFIEKKEL